MSDRHDEATETLSREDAALVRRIADATQAAPLSAARRVAFNAALEARLARRRRPEPLRALAGVATALVVWLVVATSVPTTPPTPDLSPEDALLALLELEPAGADTALPDEYRAIASVLLGEG